MKLKQISKIKQHFFICSFTIIASIFTISITEAFARFFYKQPWFNKLVLEHEVAQNKSDDIESALRFGRFEIRSNKIPLDKQPGDKHILFLGDSFTFGSGVKDSLKTFPSILENRYNSEKPVRGVNRIRVFNGGLPGSLTDSWLALWKKIQPKFHPDLVILVFFLRDGTRISSIGNAFFGSIRNEIIIRNQKSLLYEYFYIYRFIRDQIDLRLIGSNYTKEFNRSYFGNSEETTEWKNAQLNLIEISQLARKKFADVGFVIFPVLVDLKTPYPFQKITDHLEDFGNKAGMRVHNLLPSYWEMHGPDLWVSPYDQHPNELAHQIAANSLYPYLLELLVKNSNNIPTGKASDM